MLSAFSSQLGTWLVVVVVPHTNPSAANPDPLKSCCVGAPSLSSFLRPTTFHVPEGLRSLESQSLSSSGVPETSKIPPFPSYSFWRLVQGFVHVVVCLGGRPVVVQLVWFVTP